MLAFILRTLACALALACAYWAALLVASRVSLMASTRQAFRLEDILRDRALCFFMMCAASLVFSFATTPWLMLPGILFAWVFSKRVGPLLDARAQRELRSACDEQVDVMADIIAMGVQSGLSFDASLDLYCEKFDNALARQLKSSRLQWESGLASRQQALESLASNVSSKAIRRFSDTSLQAIHYGSPLAGMLRRFSSDVRRQRRSAIERQIAKAPVKLLIPTGTCILPAMLILVMGPVLLQFIQTGF